MEKKRRIMKHVADATMLGIINRQFRKKMIIYMMKMKKRIRSTDRR